MADNQLTQIPDKSALIDPDLSPQAIAVAAARVLRKSHQAGDLGFSDATYNLAMWELVRAGYITSEVI